MKPLAFIAPRVWPALALLLLAGCGRDEIKVYRAAKDAPEPVEATTDASSPADVQPAPRLKWELPAGWTEKPPRKMLAGEFEISAKDGRQAEVLAIPLVGVAGRDLDVVNMWRQELELEPMTEAELAGAEKIAVGSGEGRLIEMASKKPIIEGKQTARTISAMAQQAGASWFFKLTGEASLVHEQKAAFLNFLKSLKFEEAPPMMSSAAPPFASGGGMAAAGDTTLPAWQVPAGWQPQPASPMSLATFLLGTAGQAQAKVTVSTLEGDGGGALANVNRWRGQLGLAPAAESDLASLLSPVELAEGKASLVDLSGTDARTGKKARMLAVMAPRPRQTWFYKLMGDEGVVAAAKDEFVKFVQSARYSAPVRETTAVAPPDAAPVAASSDRPIWEPPANWQEQPGSAMVLASFVAIGDAGSQARISVSMFGGTGGGPLANINRWRDQLKLDHLDEAGLSGVLQKLDVLGGKAMVVDMSGTDAKTGKAARLVAAIVTRDANTWFYKLMGDGPVVAREKEAFLKFVQTIRYPNG